MGNLVDAPMDDNNVIQSSTNIGIDTDVYEDAVNQYLTSIGILSAYNPNQPFRPINHTYSTYRHVYKRERVMQFLWPQCIGIPMLSFDLDANDDIAWWVHMFRPYVDHILANECVNDRARGVFMFLGWSIGYEEHLTVLHFDPVHRVQTFFDPMQHATRLMSDRPLATGYTTHGMFHDIPLQMVLEWYQHDSVPDGVCSAVCVLMVLCCHRFGTSDIHGMQAIVTRLVWNRHRDISTIRHNLWMFYIRLGRLKVLSDVLQHVGLFGRSVTGTCTAAVRNDSGTKLVPCNHQACAGWAYCSDHIERLLASNQIKIHGTSPTTCGAVLLEHYHTAPRPVAVHFENIEVDRSVWLCTTAWTPPEPYGIDILKGGPGQRWFVQIERVLLSVGMAILRQTLDSMMSTTPSTVPLLYLRLSGFLLPDEADYVFDVIHNILESITLQHLHHTPAPTMDLCIDIALPGEAKEKDPAISKLKAFIPPLRSTVSAIHSIRTATLLLCDTEYSFTTEIVR